MICQYCDGKGFKLDSYIKLWDSPKHLRPKDEVPNKAIGYLPCMACNGSGMAYCCEGSGNGGSCDREEA